MSHPIARLLGIDAPTSGLRYLSVCSGIEAATTAWHGLGWTPAAFSEIEAFPSAVLAQHWPHVPNLGDMTKWHEWDDELLASCDLIVGGTPCQAFSVAGLRNSLDDDRGNLTLIYVQLIDHIDRLRAERGLQPVIVVWENVPGVLSTKDNAFGCFLGSLAGDDQPVEPGPRPEHGKTSLHWGWQKDAGLHRPKWSNAGHVAGPKRSAAWRTLDAQYFGVAQRRRRVFLVASARKGFRPDEVLFESEGVRRDSPPSREAGQGAARSTGDGVAGGGGWPARVSPTLNAAFGEKQGLEDQHALGGAGLFVPQAYRVHGEHSTAMTCNGAANVADPVEVARCLDSSGGFATNQGGNVVTHSLRAEGFDASEDGTGRGTPLVPTTYAIQERAVSENLENGPQGKGYQPDKAYTLEARNKVQAVAYAATDYKEGKFESVEQAGPLTTSADRTRPAPVVAFSCKDYGADAGEQSPTLRSMSHDGSHANGGGQVAVAFAQNTRDEVREMDVVGALAAEPGMKQTSYLRLASAVRRLTPTECERLQGFPDGHTLIPWRGKDAEQCPDGPRYKALGNSMAVPCMAWIGRRIHRHLSE